MNKVAVLITAVILLVAVGYLSLNQGTINKQIAEFKGFSRVCVAGVNYLQFPSGATVEYNVDGTIKRCD